MNMSNWPVRFTGCEFPEPKNPFNNRKLESEEERAVLISLKETLEKDTIEFTRIGDEPEFMPADYTAEVGQNTIKLDKKKCSFY